MTVGSIVRKTKIVKLLIQKTTAALGVSATVLAMPLYASDACEITSDTISYYEKRENAVMLMQYADLVIRATDGNISCSEEVGENRQVCLVDGKGELLVEGGDRAPHIIEMNSDALGEVHIYASADLSCGLKSDFDRFR